MPALRGFFVYFLALSISEKMYCMANKSQRESNKNVKRYGKCKKISAFQTRRQRVSRKGHQASTKSPKINSKNDCIKNDEGALHPLFCCYHAVIRLLMSLHDFSQGMLPPRHRYWHRAVSVHIVLGGPKVVS